MNYLMHGDSVSDSLLIGGRIGLARLTHWHRRMRDSVSVHDMGIRKVVRGEGQCR
jgi:hypothetical protein